MTESGPHITAAAERRLMTPDERMAEVARIRAESNAFIARAWWAEQDPRQRTEQMSALRFDQFTDRAREEKPSNDEGKTE